MKRLAAIVMVVCIVMISMSVCAAEKFELVEIVGKGMINATYGMGDRVYLEIVRELEGLPMVYELSEGKTAVDAQDYFEDGCQVTVLPAVIDGKEYFVLAEENDRQAVVIAEGKEINRFDWLYRLNGRLWEIDKYPEGSYLYDITTNSVRNDAYEAFSDFTEDGGFGKLKSDGKWYWIDESGIKTDVGVTLPEDKYIYRYLDEGVFIYLNNDYMCGLVNKDGKILTEAVYGGIYSPKGGIVPAQKNGKTGFLDLNGIEVVPFIYEEPIPADVDNEIIQAYFNEEVKEATEIYSYVDMDTIVINATGETVSFDGMEIRLLGERMEYIIAEAKTDENILLTSIYQVKIKDDGIKVKVNGVKVKFDQEPMIENGRTLVPLRAIFEALGAQVSWDDTTKTVTAQKGDTLVKLTIGSNELNVNGAVKMIDVPAQIVNSRTMVPARAVAEAFGCEVSWEEDTRTVIIKE